MAGAATRGPRSSVTRRRIETIDFSGSGPERILRRDALVAEEPLEIRIAASGTTRPVAVTMRTPGSDFQLAAGFLFGEGWFDDPGQIEGIRYCSGIATGGHLAYNAVDVVLRQGVAADVEGSRRHCYATSSCGVCGKGSIAAILETIRGRVTPGPVVASEVLFAMPDALKRRQRLFARTGGLHAAALFTPAGELIALHEDVGRHNALDKLIGEVWLDGATPLDERLVLVSGRISFELVQKAARAGVPLLAGVSAPSSLAVDLAEEFGITLIGFLRNRRFNLYSGRERIADLPVPFQRRV